MKFENDICIDPENQIEYEEKLEYEFEDII